MADIMGAEPAEGEAGGNTNMNMNMNMNMKKKRRKRRSNWREKQKEAMSDAFEDFETEPSNVTMINEYERIAKKGINEYFKAMKRKEMGLISNIFQDNPKFSPKQKIVYENVAIDFFGNLMDSYKEFKEYCANTNHVESECAILETDWSQFGQKH